MIHNDNSMTIGDSNMNLDLLYINHSSTVSMGFDFTGV
jgi:hypothetical protein